MNDINDIDDSAAQHQDQLEKEQRLEEILIEIYGIVMYSSQGTSLTEEDIDFVAAACGKSDYRKP